MKKNGLAIILLVLMLSGCTSFHAIKPLSPEVGNPNFPSQVETLQPTFKWEEAQGAGITYDLIVYEGIKVESFWEGVKRSVGKELYYREGLPQPEHKMEVPLEPGREYYWSVRTRQGEKVSEWAKYDYTLFLGTAYMRAGNQPFIFETPKQ